jgi:Transposase DDE domain
LLPLLDAVRDGTQGEGRLVLADRGYDSRAVRAGIQPRGYQPGIAVRNKRGEGKAWTRSPLSGE